MHRTPNKLGKSIGSTPNRIRKYSSAVGATDLYRREFVNRKPPGMTRGSTASTRLGSAKWSHKFEE